MKFFVNFLSSFRIFASFAMIGTLWPFAGADGISENQIWITIVLFAAAALSDFLDGYLARRYNACTKLGGVLDSIADKFLIINAFILMCIILPTWFIAVPIMVMIARELYISGLREFAGTQRISMSHPHSRFAPGKIKAALQMISVLAFLLFTLMYAQESIVYASWLFDICVFSLWFALGTSLWSAIQYTTDFIHAARKTK